MQLRDGDDAELVVALMNGDLETLGNVSAETLAHCHKTIQGLLSGSVREVVLPPGSEAAHRFRGQHVESQETRKEDIK
jgi:hypothetical protein